VWSINNFWGYSGKKLSLYSGKILDFEEPRQSLNNKLKDL